MLKERNFHRKLFGSASLFMVLFACFSAANAEPPSFIQMYGEWESVGVRADPPEVFDAMPQLKIAHEIIGTPSHVMPGIHFIVRQNIGGEVMKTEINYAYDDDAKKSFGLLASSSGSVLRGVYEHGESFDTLQLFDSNDEVVWTESNTWISRDRFESEATFEFEGEEAKVWFVTQRIVGD